MLLHGGPGDGQVVPGGDDTIVWRACLYEITPEYGHRHGRNLRVYRHRPDCCEPYGRGAEDRCEYPPWRRTGRLVRHPTSATGQTRHAFGR